MDQMNYTPQTPGAPVPPAPTPPAPAPQPVYAKGCISAGWADIKATPGYVGKLVVLGLIMCVPVLNFAAMGYLLFWAREVPFGGRTPMPQKYVTGKNFEFGFYGFVITLVVGIATNVAGWILGLIPLLGALVALALMLAGSVTGYIMQMRMIMGQNLGAGFDLKDLWNVSKRNWGQLLLVTLVPELIAAAILSVLVMIITSMMLLVMLGTVAPAAAAAVSPTDVLGIIALVGLPMVLALLVLYVVGCLIMVVAQAVTVRGLGHWVARYAPEWTALAPVIPPAQPTPPVYPQNPSAPLQ